MENKKYFVENFFIPQVLKRKILFFTQLLQKNFYFMNIFLIDVCKVMRNNFCNKEFVSCATRNHGSKIFFFHLSFQKTFFENEYTITLSAKKRKLLSKNFSWVWKEKSQLDFVFRSYRQGQTRSLTFPKKVSKKTFILGKPRADFLTDRSYYRYLVQKGIQTAYI